MSDFLNKLSEKIGKGVDTITNKSKVLYETTKIRNEISGLVRHKKQLLFEAGRKGYELSKTGEWSTSELTTFYEEVAKLEVMIEEKNREIDRIYEEEKQRDPSFKPEGVKPEDKQGAQTADFTQASEAGADVQETPSSAVEDSLVYHDEEDEEISFEDDDK